LVPFALQYLEDVDGLVEQDGDEAFQHAKVGLVAKHALGGPVETDEFVGLVLGIFFSEFSISFVYLVQMNEIILGFQRILFGF